MSEVKAMPPPPEGLLIEPESIYHAKSKAGEVMSSGMLKKFSDCPDYYHRLVTGQAFEKADSTAFRFGRAVHKIVLEGIPAFNKAYTTEGPINPKTGTTFGVGTKAHDAWLAERGLSREQCLTDNEWTTLLTMAKAAMRHTKAAAWLEFGWPELVCRADLHGVPCQIRMDWLTHDADGNYMIVDLKTTTDMSWFEKSDVKIYRYLNQFALYRDVFQAAMNRRVAFGCITLEKNEPFRAAAWTLATETLDVASVENQAFLAYYLHCKKENNWPTGYEETREISLPRSA